MYQKKNNDITKKLPKKIRKFEEIRKNIREQGLKTPCSRIYFLHQKKYNKNVKNITNQR